MTAITIRCERLPNSSLRGLAAHDQLAALEKVAARYAVAITPAMADLIDPSDPHDPIARQFVPDPRELDPQPEELSDPIGDEAHSPVEGIVHRYPDRVLLKLVNACAVYCRFCFRRETVGPGRGGLCRAALAAALDYIRVTPQIWEVILTGGDPLVLSPRRLKEVTAALAAIDHVKVIRVHTRVPVAAPERISPALVRGSTLHQGGVRRRCMPIIRANSPKARAQPRAFRRCRHSGARASPSCCAASTTMPRRSAR